MQAENISTICKNNEQSLFDSNKNWNRARYSITVADASDDAGVVRRDLPAVGAGPSSVDLALSVLPRSGGRGGGGALLRLARALAASAKPHASFCDPCPWLASLVGGYCVEGQSQTDTRGDLRGEARCRDRIELVDSEGNCR